MKILIIRYESSFIGGEQIYIAKLIKALKEKEHNVHQVILDENPSKSEFIEQADFLCSTKIIKCNISNSFYSLFSHNLVNLRLYSELRLFIRSFNPDIIHLHTAPLVKTVLLASRGFPKIQTIHEMSVIFPLFPLFFNLDNKTKYDGKIYLGMHKIIGLKFRTILFDYMIFGNDWIKKRTIRYFLCPSKYLTNLCKNAGFENSVHFPYFQELFEYDFEKIRNIKNKNYLLFVGRLDRIKGVNYLLRAFKIVHAKNKLLKLVIVGDGPERKTLEELSNKLGINKFVEFVGTIDNDKIDNYYKNAITVVIPSIYPETGPLVALEAMNYSKPIIAFGVGGLLDFVKNGANGFLVENCDINSFADKINFILRNKKIADKMGENGRKMLEEKWSKEKHIDKLINIYNSAILNTKTLK